METESETFKKRFGTSNRGISYEIHLVMLFLFEAGKRKEVKKINSFHLANNIEEGQNFDDLVFRCRYTDINGQEKSKVFFIQAKHKEQLQKKISMKELLDEKNDFALKMYLSSFIKIKQQFAQRSDHPIFQDELEDAEFIIFTNATIDLDKSRGNIKKEKMEEEHFLNIRENVNYYYTLNDTDQIMNNLKASLDYEILSKQLAKGILSKTVNINNDIIKDYHCALTEKVFEKINETEWVIRDSFFDRQDFEFRDKLLMEIESDKKCPNLPREELKVMLLNNKIKISKKIGITSDDALNIPLPKPFVNDEDINKFISRFKIFINQPNDDELEEIIKHKIQTRYRTEPNDTERIYCTVKEKVTKWRTNQNIYLTEENIYFQDAAKCSVTFEVRLPTSLFTGRKKELERLHENIQCNDNQIAVISQMTTISGLGGIGKTELARQYIKEYSHFFDNNVIWINAENDNNVTGSFLRLAQDKLKIPTTNFNGEEKNIVSIIEDVYQFFSKRKSLFVFDNVENCKNVDKVLPLESLKSDDNRPYILITSREREWERGIKVIDLYVMEKEEAVELVKKGLNIRDDSEDKEIEKLVEKLEYFPLAITQAIAYILDEQITDEYTITNYLEEFEDNSKNLLKSELFKGIDNNYTKTTYTTWKITINKISKDNNYGRMALKLLYVMAYISNENILREMFTSLFDNQERQLKSTIRLLINYSMINGEQKQSVLNIHKLVQEVIRLEVTDQNKGIDIIEESFQMLKQYYFRNEYGTNVAKKRQLIPHIEMLLHQIDKNLNNNPNLNINCLEDLLQLLGNGYYNVDPRNAKKVFERIFEDEKEKYGLCSSKVIETMIKLASTEGQLGNYENKKCLLEQALEIEKIHHVANNDQMLIMYANLLITYDILKNNDELIELCLKLFNSFGIPISKQLLENFLEDKGFEDFRFENLMQNTIDFVQEILNFIKSDPSINAMFKSSESQIDFVITEEFLTFLCNLVGVNSDLVKKDNLVNILQMFSTITRDPGSFEKFSFLEVIQHFNIFTDGLENPNRALDVIESFEQKFRSMMPSPFINLVIYFFKECFNIQDSDKHKATLEHSLKLSEENYGPEHYKTASILVLLGNAHGNLGNPAEEVELLKKALDIQRKHYGMNSLEVADTLTNLSSVYEKLEEFNNQIDVLKEVLRILEKVFHRDDVKLISTLKSLSNAYAKINDDETKQYYLKRISDIQGKFNGPE